jgi:hypothetical protein
VTTLYRQFFGALAPGGVLVTSFLTPPPVLDPQSEWDLARVDREALLLERIVLADVLNARFSAFRSSAATIAQLASAGFEDLDILWDNLRIFPTVVARRPARAR